METHSVLNKKENNLWVALLYFLLSTTAIAFLFYFLSSGFIYPFSVGGEPAHALPPTLLLWLTFGMIILLGVTPFMLLSLSKNQNKAGMRLSFSLFYALLLGVILWAMLSFMLALPTAGIIFLGLAICLGFYVVYRFLTRCIVAGVILSIFDLYLIYIFATQLAYLLLR